jgi:isopenicillin-N epimerase
MAMLATNQRDDDRDTTSDPNRRSFMAMLAAAGAGVAAGGPAMAQSVGAGAAALKNDVDFWKAIRGVFTLNPRTKFMNIGTAGSMPIEVLEVLNTENRRAARESLNGYGNFRAIREQIAPGFGCDADEIVISGNTSDGMNHALFGLQWERGDEIVTTNHEHPGGNVPMALLQDRFGVVIKRVTVPVGNNQKAEDYVELFSKAITPKTKALVWSSPTYKTGTMLPVKMLAKLASDRGLISICDGAHLPGMMNYSYRDTGLDFMAGAAHKWQCAPLGTGILYIRNKVNAQANPRPLPVYFPAISSSYPLTGGLPARATGPKETDDLAARVQSCGSRNVPVYVGTAKACEVWDRIGRQKIEDYTLALSAYLKEKIVAKWGVDSLYSPKDDPRLVCALTGFNPFRKTTDIMDKAKSDGFVKRMQDEYGFIIRNVNFPVPGGTQDHFGVRVSTHIWTNVAEIDQLVDAMWDLSNKMTA